MDTESTNIFQDARSTIVRKVDIFGQHEDGKTTFDHRDEAEPVGNYLPQMRVDSVSLWFKRTDNQNVLLQGICASYKKLNEDNFFESFDSCDDEIKNSDRDYDILHFDDGEYIREINVTTASANQRIGAIEFVTTNKGRKVIAYGSANSEDGKQSEPLPPGDTKKFDFLKGDGDNFPGYVVGFYGQYDGKGDNSSITHLGVYIAPLTQINYWSRRPYILAFKKMQEDSSLIDKIANTLEVQKDGDKYKDANLEDTDGNSSKILFYFLQISQHHPELFKAVLEYL
mmetsp:Transcript_32643/g.29516  ORF Transcript_32643/g.29516 Transcript_32643/m.29516 type:complete len:284 (+) Transcript_32643:73-924(+)